jgi:hypothetical protein
VSSVNAPFGYETHLTKVTVGACGRGFEEGKKLKARFHGNDSRYSEGELLIAFPGA